MKHYEKNNQTWLMITFSTLLIVLSMSLTIVVTQPARPFGEPIRWEQDTYVPVHGCPGDVAEYLLLIRIANNAHLTVYSSFSRAYNHPDVIAFRESAEGQQAALQSGAEILGDAISPIPSASNVAVVLAPSVVVILEDDQGMEIDIGLILDRDSKFTLPQLPPGPYVRNIAVGVTGINAKMAFRTQPFTIREDCD